jgi:hypothetical protein
MPDNLRNREWLETEELESGAPGLPRADLNPLVNPLLAENMGRWAQVYFTSPPNQREHAVEKLLEELKAGSGSKKPASSEPISLSEKTELPKLPNSKPEIVPSGLPVRNSVDDEPHLTDEPSQHAVVCPGCLHKNSAEQRFCGICGMALRSEVAAPKSLAPPRPAQPSKHDENSESDWDWLRQRTLSGYEVQSEKRNYSRSLFVVLALLVIAAGGYFLWQNRARLTHQQAPASSVSLPEPSSAPSMTIPIPATPAPTPVKSEAKQKPQRSSPALKANEEPGLQEKANTQAGESSGTLSSDNGRDELDRARQYLSGEGVPKSSWMASQLLWKAIGKQNSDAVLLLSDLYARGDGVPRSCEQARILLVTAAKKGSPAAAQKLRSIENGCR